MKLNSLQDGYLGFSNFLDFDPQNFKNKFFLEMCSKIQHFQNSQKKYNIYRTYMRVVSMPNSIFDPQNVSHDFHVVFLMITSCDLTVTLTCT